eukprot:TRINITY_DN46759_c0_g1_i1.p1 TRINITY_DN46759_c0_g1~~TRINITY_DN46759_c0_g1_i1.p1  ORF type:complete len:361 (+),score=68.34 TRINITY_DN46759_c0_g1_i1:69-1085(+)
MTLRRTVPCLGTSFGAAVDFLPPRYKLDHGPDQYGVEKHFIPPTGVGKLQLTPPTNEELYEPIKEPFLVPPKYRKNYNFSVGHGKYLYAKDPLWVEARERYWDDMQLALQVHRRNYDHLRKMYKKQWHDANRYNLDEYLTVMTRVKLEEKAAQEMTDEDTEARFREDLAKIDAINELKEKRRKMIYDRWWKLGIWRYERYTEDLQYLQEFKVKDFVTFDNMDSIIEEQIGRWRQSDSRKLNMFGRVPYAENEACQPELEVQYLFMKEDLSEDGREAYSRLVQVSESSLTGISARVTHDATYTDFNFDDEGSLEDSEIEASGEEKQRYVANPKENADEE